MIGNFTTKMSKLANYLHGAKQNFSGWSGPVRVVAGNEACDLDSAVTAITYAYLLHLIHPPQGGEGECVVALLNIPRRDYALRTEVTHWLAKHGVTSDHLVFRDEIDLSGLHTAGRLRLTLVDHNVLPAADQGLEGSVTEVLDHHRLERGGGAAEVEVAMVGSCCTLVAERWLARAPQHLTPDVATLLYGTILLDTVNLSEAAKRVTARDVEAVRGLQAHLDTPPSRDEMFQELTTAKGDVSGLTLDQLLRKDRKVVTAGGVQLAMSSVPMLAKEFVGREGAAAALGEHASSQGFACVVVMGISIAGDNVTRDLAVFGLEEQLRQAVCRHLQEAEGGLLGLQEVRAGEGLVLFRQGNHAASRKVVLPLIKQWLADRA